MCPMVAEIVKIARAFTRLGLPISSTKSCECTWEVPPLTSSCSPTFWLEICFGTPAFGRFPAGQAVSLDVLNIMCEHVGMLRIGSGRCSCPRHLLKSTFPL